VRVVKGPSEAEENAESVGVLKIRVFLVMENRLLRDVLARLLRRQADVELSGKVGAVKQIRRKWRKAVAT
jgi:hypothetical protein